MARARAVLLVQISQTSITLETPLICIPTFYFYHYVKHLFAMVPQIFLPFTVYTVKYLN